jgi:hypothetical protein
VLFQIAAHQAQRARDRGIDRLCDHEEQDVLKLGRTVGTMNRRDAPRAGVAYNIPAVDRTAKDPTSRRIEHNQAKPRGAKRQDDPQQHPERLCDLLTTRQLFGAFNVAAPAARYCGPRGLTNPSTFWLLFRLSRLFIF